MKMEQRECSETLAYKIQTPGNYPAESIQHSEHGESLKRKEHGFFGKAEDTGKDIMEISCNKLILGL